MTQDYGPFWKAIDARIEKQGSSIRELEEHLEIPQSVIAKARKQERKPPKELRKKLAEAEEFLECEKGQLDNLLFGPGFYAKTVEYKDIPIPKFYDNIGTNMQKHVDRSKEAVYSTRERLNCYWAYAEDNANYPEIMGPSGGYSGDVLIFERASRPSEGELFHIEVTENRRKFFAVREYAITSEGRGVFKPVKPGDEHRSFPYHTQRDKSHIKIWGIFVELQRHGRPR